MISTGDEWANSELYISSLGTAAALALQSSIPALAMRGAIDLNSGVITETSWAAVTIAWNNGKMASVHHGDMREIQRPPTKLFKGTRRFDELPTFKPT